MPEEKKQNPLGDKRIFLEAAYLTEVERGTYGLYRNLVVEFFDKEKGRPVREKLKAVGPIGIFRECQGEEERRKPDMKTIHPTTGKELLLKNTGEL